MLATYVAELVTAATIAAAYTGINSILEYSGDHAGGGIVEGVADRRACALVHRIASALTPEPPPDSLALLRMARGAYYQATLDLLEQCSNDRTLDPRRADTQRDQKSLKAIAAWVKDRQKQLHNETPNPLPSDVAALLNENIDAARRAQSMSSLMVSHFLGEVRLLLNEDPVPALLDKYLTHGWTILNHTGEYVPRTWYGLVSIHFLRAVHANPAPLHTAILVDLYARTSQEKVPLDLDAFRNQVASLVSSAEERIHDQIARVLGVLDQLLATTERIEQNTETIKEDTRSLKEDTEHIKETNARMEKAVAQLAGNRQLDIPPERATEQANFVGRLPELAQLERAILGQANPSAVLVCSVSGLPGIGKSYLCDQFAFLHASRFPGGYLPITLDPAAPRSAADLIAELAERSGLQVAEAQRAAVLRNHLTNPLALIHIENVDSDPVAIEVGKFTRLLPGCPILVSGRVQSLGESQNWTRVALDILDPEESLTLLEKEFRAPRTDAERGDFRRLLATLGHLPLAIHLVGGHLRSGFSVNEIQSILLDLKPVDPIDQLAGNPRGVLRSTFEISRQLFLHAFPEPVRARWRTRLNNFGYAPLAGVGVSLGSAICDCTPDEFQRLMRTAQHLSLVTRVPDSEREKAAESGWRTHALVSTFLRATPGSSEVTSRFRRVLAWVRKKISRSPQLSPAFLRMSVWFLSRIRGEGLAREAVLAERAALVAWLNELPSWQVAQTIRVSLQFALACGPYHAWIALCDRGLTTTSSPRVQSDLLHALGNLLVRSGNPERAAEIARRKLKLELLRNQPGAARASVLLADILQARGDLDEALRIHREEVLPAFEKLGDVRMRATTLGKIADILHDRGELDAALHIRQQEELPAYRKLRDARSRAITLGKIANISIARGNPDEALRVLSNEALPVLEKLGDLRSRAITLGQLADISHARGNMDEALRIRRHEELPAYEKLGDVRERAITLGKIADILQARGELDEALRILRLEALPVYEKLGDVRMRAITSGKIANILQARGILDEALRIRRQEELPTYEKLGDARLRAMALGKIADISIARGKLDEARRSLREDVLPVFEKLGDVRSRAMTLGKIADILQIRGDLDEALRIRRQEELQVYEQLGDVREKAITLGKIANIFQSRGDLEEALRIRHQEELPVYEKLGDRRSIAACKNNMALSYLRRNRPGDRLRARPLLTEALAIAESLGLREAGQIRQTLARLPR